MRKRSIAGPHLWAPAALGEPCLLSPGQLDYPSGLTGQQQPPAAPPVRADRTNTGPASGSCQGWERAVLGSLIEQPLMTTAHMEAQQSAAERQLARLWTAHREHFEQHSRPAPGLLLTDELRVDTLAQYLPEPHVIKVRPSALTRHVLVHECCHAWTTQRHGPDFAAGMLYLLQHEFGCDREALLAKAHSLGLQITPACR